MKIETRHMKIEMQYVARGDVLSFLQFVVERCKFVAETVINQIHHRESSTLCEKNKHLRETCMMLNDLHLTNF